MIGADAEAFNTKAFANAGYVGGRPATATIIAVEIVRKRPEQVGFAVHPRRWVVERVFAWISRNAASGKIPRRRSPRQKPSSTPQPS